MLPRLASLHLATAVACLAAASCEAPLVTAPVVLTSPPTVVLPRSWEGSEGVRRPVVLRNESGYELRLHQQQLWGDEALRLVGVPELLPPGETTVTAELDDGAPAGFYRAAVRLFAFGNPGVSVEVGLLAERRRPAECPPSTECRSFRFDVRAGRCVSTDVPDGQACNLGNQCVTGGACQGGVCLGGARSCDDGDACTVDVCAPLTGCEHLPRPPCPGDGRCQQGRCDARLGCVLEPVADGTWCGTSTASGDDEVCVSGACAQRPRAEGGECAPSSPCAGPALWAGGQCQATSTPTPLVPRWTEDTLDEEEGSPGYHDLLLEPGGAVTLGRWFSVPPRVRANRPQPVTLGSPARRCILWNGRLACADHPDNRAGSVSLVSLETGLPVWTYSLAGREALVGDAEVFLARLVVQAPDRLAALYEGFSTPRRGPELPQCRQYWLVVLNARGQEVSSQRLRDAFLDGTDEDTCRHPHPYGVASDAVGNLYVAFSHTSSPNAPLLPTTPTLLASFTRDGRLRWKRLEPSMVGGELAVARGLLYPENSTVAYEAAQGDPAYTLAEPYGRAVVAGARTIPSPALGGEELRGYEAGLRRLNWTHRLPAGFRFWSEQLRLARWRTRTASWTVALTFISDGTRQALHAVDVTSGRTVFTCPLAIPGVRTGPQLVEVAEGTLAVMEGAVDPQACSKCDPPFAVSSAAFHVFELPGLSMAAEPWVGTFGGADHDHHEDAPPAAPPN